MEYDVIVIGGGQAGLAMAYALKDKKKTLILDENEQTGDSWKKRYESLRLFTPRNYSQLFDFTFRGDPKGFPHKDEVVSYLQEFEIRNQLSILHNQQVIKLSRENDQTFVVFTQNQTYKVKNVVIATGAFHDPFIPDIHDRSIPYMIHASAYTNPTQIPQGDVLIVGAGNTGIQIAAELSKTHTVMLAKSKPIKSIPQRLAGKSLFWWLETFRISKASPSSMVGKMLQKRDPIIGDDYKIVKGQVEMLGRVRQIIDGQVHIQDTLPKKVTSIIWATGYRNNYSWIDIDGVIDDHGKPIHRFGITEIKGLYFIGQSWQSKRSSALIYGVSDDSKMIAGEIL